MMLALLDAVPALFAGCAVLLKPSESHPLYWPTVRQRPRRAGTGAVFDFVTGDAETGKAVIDPVRVVCFTGSVPTGRRSAVPLPPSGCSLPSWIWAQGSG
jgi:acyl-CoA reductase-like NAD-dependent aldehyde dehydrogenase